MMKLLILLNIFILSTSTQDINLKQLRCLVCRTIVDEFKYEVNKIDASKEIEIGQYQLDSKGNTVHKKVPLSMSEVHLSDMLDSICKKMENYVRATYKSNGKLTLLKLVSDNGVNPLISEVDIVQDGDLNKILEYFCIDIINEHEDAFVEVINKKVSNAKAKICTEVAEYCTGFIEDDEDETKDISDNEEEDVKVEL